jgi:repressor LexA
LIIVLIGNYDATCKKLIKTQTGIKLLSFNPDYEPFIFTNEEVVNLPVVVLGKVVERRAKFEQGI